MEPKIRGSQCLVCVYVHACVCASWSDWSVVTGGLAAGSTGSELALCLHSSTIVLASSGAQGGAIGAKSPCPSRQDAAS